MPVIAFAPFHTRRKGAKPLSLRLMSTFLRCENGHRWNPLSRRFAHAPAVGNQCPFCAVIVSIRAEEAHAPANLPEPIFTAREPWNPERIHAMAIYCSDGRFGEAFDEFCQEGLGIPRYDRFAVPGGPLWLVTRDVSLMIPHSAARDQLQFLVKAHELSRIVL